MPSRRRVVTVATPGSRPDAALVALLSESDASLTVADDASTALLEIGRLAPALVIVPTDLADVDPVAMVDAVARQSIPVLAAMTSDAESSATAVSALDAGATGIVALPLSAKDIVDALDRLSPAQPDQLKVGELVMDVDAHRVTVRGHEVPLSAREFTLLRHLLARAGHLVSLNELESFALSESQGSPTALRVMIARIRRKLESSAPDTQRLLETVRGVGYRIADEAELRP